MQRADPEAAMEAYRQMSRLEGVRQRAGAKAVVIGGKGMLGIDLMAALEADGAFWPAIVGDLPEVDITDEASLHGFFDKTRPLVIFNCAAYTDVDGCESNEDTAFAVNGTGAGNVAAVAASLDAHLVHVSTDFVFDGKKNTPYVEDDAVNPLSLYGRSKLDGEKRITERGGRWTIARTAWLYGKHGKNFVDMMLSLARDREELKVVTDQIGSPTWTCDLAAALIALAKASAQGIYHTTNAGACSRFEQVKAIVESAGLSTRIEPVDSSAFPRPATVPAYSVLSTEKLQRDTGHAMRHWKEALQEYVRNE